MGCGEAGMGDEPKGTPRRLCVLSPKAYEVYHQTCRVISTQGSGLSWRQLNDAYALALVFNDREPDMTAVEVFGDRLEP